MSRTEFVDRAANKITELGLGSVAILLLEAHRPLAFIGGQVLLVAQPTLNLFLSPDLTRQTVDLLSTPDRLEQLISRLEQMAGARPPKGS